MRNFKQKLQTLYRKRDYNGQQGQLKIRRKFLQICIKTMKKLKHEIEKRR